MADKKPEDVEVQLEVRKLQDYITEHFYKCSGKILNDLGKMYASGGEFTENIDKVAGSGTAVFVAKTIEIYVIEPDKEQYRQMIENSKRPKVRNISIFH